MTIDELKAKNQDAKSRLEHLAKFLKIDERKKQIAEIEAVMAAPDFWDAKEKAQTTVQALSAAKGAVEPFRKLASQGDDF